MDSRDIKEEPGIIEGGKYLEEIYQMQKNLLSNYIGIEGLPEYPIDINTKKSQTLLKDFTGRVIEELSEGYESFQNVDLLMSKYNPHLFDENVDKYVEVLNSLQNANEENADAIHFMIELLIYANIQPEDIKSYINLAVGKYNSQVIRTHLKEHESDILYQAMFLGLNEIMDKQDLEFVGNPNRVSLHKLYLESDEGNLPEYNLGLLNGGRNYNQQEYRLSIPYILWYITHHLNVARNFLKNKPWKQSQMMTQEVKYQEELVKAFLILCGYLAFIGMNSKQVFYIYFKKNHINQFRIKSKY